MRITAAVYEALSPILNEMREDIISSVKSDIVEIKNEITTISQSVSNQTEDVKRWWWSVVSSSARFDMGDVTLTKSLTDKVWNRYIWLSYEWFTCTCNTQL